MKPNEIKNINTNTGVVQLMDIANFGVSCLPLIFLFPVKTVTLAH